MGDVLSEGLTPKQLAARLGVTPDDLTAEHWPPCPKCGSLLMPTDYDTWHCTNCTEEWSRKT